MTFGEYGFTLEDYVTKELKLPLERGGRYVCCPLHDEDTASFRIYDEEDTFYCFGCNVGGDVVVLHQKLEAKKGRGISYGVALGEVRKIVYKYTKNEKVLETGKAPRKSNYVVDGKRVVARAISHDVSTASVLDASQNVTNSGTNVANEEQVKAPVAKDIGTNKGRNPLEVMHLLQVTKRSIWAHESGEAQKYLYRLENP